jgi:hypothetical protein
MLFQRQQRETKLGWSLEQDLADTLQLIKWMLDPQSTKKPTSPQEPAAGALPLQHNRAIDALRYPDLVL